MVVSKWGLIKHFYLGRFWGHLDIAGAVALGEIMSRYSSLLGGWRARSQLAKVHSASNFKHPRSPNYKFPHIS